MAKTGDADTAPLDCTAVSGSGRGQDVLGLLRTVLMAGWRRRKMATIPLLIIIPACIAAAYFGPKKYQTSALILLQEESGLVSNGSGRDALLESTSKIRGLDALLRSSYVLAQAVNRLDPHRAQRQVAEWELDDWREALGVEQLGANFVKVSLKGNHRDGLADKLNVVLGTLFEELLVPTSAIDALSFLANRQQLVISQIEAELGDLEGNQGGNPVLSTDELRRRLKDVRNRAEANRLALANERAAFAAERSSVLGVDTSKPVETVIADLERELKELPITDGQLAADLSAKLQKVKDLAVRESKIAVLAADAEAADKDVQAQTESLKRLEKLESRKAELTSEAQRLRARYDTLVTRGKENGGSISLDLLQAPAKAQIIDLPRDPSEPMASSLSIILFGLASALLLSVGLSIIAELLDGSLRHASTLETATGKSVVAVFNQWPANEPEWRQMRDQASAGGIRPLPRPLRLTANGDV